MQKIDSEKLIKKVEKLSDEGKKALIKKDLQKKNKTSVNK